MITISGGFDAKTKTLNRVTIMKMNHTPLRKGEPDLIVYAKRATANDDRGMNWKFYDGPLYTLRANPKTGINEDMLTVDFDSLDTLPRDATVGKTFDGVLSSEITDPNRKSFLSLQREIADDKAVGNDTRGKGS